MEWQYRVEGWFWIRYGGHLRTVIDRSLDSYIHTEVVHAPSRRTGKRSRQPIKFLLLCSGIVYLFSCHVQCIKSQTNNQTTFNHHLAILYFLLPRFPPQLPPPPLPMPTRTPSANAPATKFSPTSIKEGKETHRGRQTAGIMPCHPTPTCDIDTRHLPSPTRKCVTQHSPSAPRHPSQQQRRPHRHPCTQPRPTAAAAPPRPRGRHRPRRGRPRRP